MGTKNSPISVAIVGARGYSGQELARILLRHPKVELKACFGSGGAGSAAWTLADSLPELASAAIQVPTRDLADVQAGEFGVVFLATPAEVSIELAPALLKKGISVVDLSGAFRLTAPEFKEWYGAEHGAPRLLDRASYGLVPWAGPVSRAQPQLISNPGCYATSVLMALIPLLRDGVIRPDSIAIDAKSGTTGAGRKANESQLFAEVEGDCLPYKVGQHQHLPELRRYAAEFGGTEIDPFFATHLLPVRRGITSAIYARLAKPFAEVAKAYDRAYSSYPLLRHSAGGAMKLESLRKVVGSARTHVTYFNEGDKLYVFSAIDNLLKGAASQAVENFNRMHDLPVGTGLLEMEGTL